MGQNTSHSFYFVPQSMPAHFLCKNLKRGKLSGCGILVWEARFHVSQHVNRALLPGQEHVGGHGLSSEDWLSACGLHIRMIRTVSRRGIPASSNM